MGAYTILDYFPQELSARPAEYTQQLSRVIEQYVRWESAIIDTQVKSALIELHAQGRAWLGKQGPRQVWLEQYFPTNKYLRNNTDVRIIGIPCAARIVSTPAQKQAILDAGNRIYATSMDQATRYIQSELLYEAQRI